MTEVARGELSVGCGHVGLWAVQERYPDSQGSTRSMDLGVPMVFPSIPLSSPSGFLGGQHVGKATGQQVA